MTSVNNIADWLFAMRDHVGPKLVTGRRGIGKSAQLTLFADRLLADGMPPGKILLLDGASSLAYRLSSSERMMDYIAEHCPGTEEIYILIREGSAFPDIETTLGALAAFPRFNVFATASSRHALTAGLGTYLDGNFAHYECLPPLHDDPSTDFRRIWHEALLYDVCTPIRQPFNAQILNSLACHLADNTGDPLSLRKISAAVSPANCLLSPHTIDNYLTALSDAYLIVKCSRFDLAEECVLKSQYRCYFTSPSMRTVLFGAAPADEPRRMRLNVAWLKLQHVSDEVFAASSGAGLVDFVTRHGRTYKLWHVDEQGISAVSRTSFVAG